MGARPFPFPLVISSLVMSAVSLVATVGQVKADDMDTLPFESFYCGIKSYETIGGDRLNVPATVGTLEDTEVVIYYWVRDYYTETAETPLVICDRVSSTLDMLNQQGNLGSIDQGLTSEGEAAICANTACSRPIFTLLPEEDPEQVLEDLRLALTTNPDNSNGGSRSYVPPLSPIEASGRSADGASR